MYFCIVIKYSMNDNPTSKWLKGVAYEVAFWNNVYRWDKTFNGMIGWSHYGDIIALEEFDANTFLQQEESPLVLDVGCGMSYATGNYIGDTKKKKPLDIHYIDPLASYFNIILQRYKRDMPPIEFGSMEHLSYFYNKKNVSLIIIQNALDHSSQPEKGVLEALRSLKIGGILYLNHHPNEAVVEHYKGFHQYNIDIKNGEMVIWNNNQHISINNLVSDCADIEVKRHNNGHVIAIIRKKQELPDQHCIKEDDIRQLSKNINKMNKLSYWKYNTIQFFVQALSWETKMRLKKMIKQA